MVLFRLFRDTLYASKITYPGQIKANTQLIVQGAVKVQGQYDQHVLAGICFDTEDL